MATKKYVVREGFVMHQALTKPDGSTYQRTYNGGEEVTLDDADAAPHLHKLEYAGQKDRDAALAAERQASIAALAGQNPVDLVQALVAALGQAQAAAPTDTA